MRKPVTSVIAALAVALGVALGLVFLNAYRKGITIRMGDGPRGAPPPPPPPAAAAETAHPYTNEQFHSMLQEEASQLGIRRFVAHGERPEDEPRGTGFMGSRLGAPQTRTQAEASIREISRLRRSFEAGKPKPVPLEGKVVPVLAEPDEGGAAVEPEPQTPAAKLQARPGPARASEPGFWSGLYGGAEEGTLTLSDAGAWGSLWSRLAQEPVPEVDFTRKEVVGVFLGPRPSGGFRVEISPSVTVLPAAVVVRYREFAPAAGRTPPEGATAPYALRAIDKTALPVRFEKQR